MPVWGIPMSLNERSGLRSDDDFEDGLGGAGLDVSVGAGHEAQDSQVTK